MPVTPSILEESHTTARATSILGKLNVSCKTINHPPNTTCYDPAKGVRPSSAADNAERQAPAIHAPTTVTRPKANPTTHRGKPSVQDRTNQMGDSVHRGRSSVSPTPPTRGPTSLVKEDKTYGPARDRLDRLVANTTERFRAASSYEEYIRTIRGRGDLHPDVGMLPHPAAQLLSRYQKIGTPAMMQNGPWSSERIDEALIRGPHKSAKLGVPFLRDEFADMIKKQQWTVLPAALVKDIPGIRLSPVGLVPQTGRRDRTIVDYSYFDVNADTVPLAAKEAMQFGRALVRLLHRIHRSNARYGPVYMSKIDLSDGFYRLWLRPQDTIRMAVLLPTREGEEPLVAIPLTNPMGWTESPPNFSACTETVADLANVGINDPIESQDAQTTPHRLDVISETPPPTTAANDTTMPTLASTTPYTKPIWYWDIYVDDFLGLAQGNRWQRRKIKRILLRALDKVFRPLDNHDTSFRQEPASLKKMKKGDATWTTHKVLLGWSVDSVKKTITLPEHRRHRLSEILDSIPPTTRTIATKDWHRIMGELRSMSIALPGSKGLFSVLQEAFRHEELDRPRLRLTRTVHGFLEDFRWLAQDILRRPTRIAELVPDHCPATLGACDAAGTGMGGVHFVPDEQGVMQPLMWRQPFPQWVQNRLVSFTNPEGDITNSDLELAGAVAQHDILAQTADVTERTIHSSYDNTAAVYWQRKGATTTTGPAAYLLRLHALHQREHRYVPLRDYIPGPSNVMADALSRRWDLTDNALLSYFNLQFPQDKPWALVPLHPTMHSNLMLALSRRRCKIACVSTTPTKRSAIGKCGAISACQKALIHSCVRPLRVTPSSTSKSTLHDIATAESPPAVGPSDLAQWRTPYVPSVRRSPYWGPRTPGKTTESPTTVSKRNSSPITARTSHPTGSNPSPSPLWRMPWKPRLPRAPPMRV